jgi:glycosyltransferase involved in cell wall biosynthesis
VEAVTMDYLVSVVIPTCDRPDAVGRAVRSALAQTHRALDVVVVDDCSSTPLVLPDELTSDARVSIVRLQERSGAGEARNVGVRASRGDLIAFLDDDDEWRPTKIERQLEILREHGDAADAVECGFDLWDGRHLILRYLPDPDRDLRKALLAKPYLQPSTVLLRRSAFEALGGFDRRLTRVEDWELWVRFSESYRAAALPEALVDRQDSATDPAELLRWYREIVRILEPRIEALPPAERSRTRRTHLLVESELLAQLGERRAAAAKAVDALQEVPRAWPRPVLNVTRSIIGESAWRTGKRGFQAVARPVLRRFGRDPLVRR